MSYELVANEDCTVGITEVAPTSATLSIITPASLTNFANEKGVYSGTMNISISGATDGVYTQVPPVFPATIEPTATKYEADGSLVIRDGDEGATVNVPGIDGASAPGTIAITPVITDAGQDKVFSK